MLLYQQFARVIYTLFFILLLAAPASAGPSLQEITGALDRAHGPADIARQAAILEAMTAKSGTFPYVEENIQLTRAYYLLGEAEKDKGKKNSYLDKALKTSKYVFQYDPGNVHALYWRSMALLLKADISGPIKALGYVKEALKGLEAVSSADPSYDSAGAYRSRGKVLIDAPSWSFIGDRKKGILLLEKASAIAPGNLVNRLYLAQGYIKDGNKARARDELSYIKSAPVDEKNKDDLEVKEEAKKLAGDFGL